MYLTKTAAILAVALACAACGQGNSDNVMSPEANPLEPAEVNAALGPELANTEANLLSNDMKGIGSKSENSPATTDSAADNATD